MLIFHIKCHTTKRNQTGTMRLKWVVYTSTLHHSPYHLFHFGKSLISVIHFRTGSKANQVKVIHCTSPKYPICLVLSERCKQFYRIKCLNLFCITDQLFTLG